MIIIQTMKLMLRTSLFALILVLAVPATHAVAGSPTPTLSLGEIATSNGLTQKSGCLQFVDRKAVEYRKERWLRAIQQMYKHQPTAVLEWLIGASEPPEFVAQEARRQKDCLIEAMFREAAKPDSPLIVDWWDRTSKKSEMSEVVRSFDRKSRYSKRIVERITRSSHRDAKTQSWIWKRKFIFRSNSFNRVSPRAAKRCSLRAGRTWNPAMRSHENCWRNKLSGPEREREILGASAAPGISRHHWGTEFDLFSLNPRNFKEGARLADEFEWLSKKGHQFGYFQPYRANTHDHGYMEERWHWSYYPIGQALLEFALSHEAPIQDALQAQWASFETKWNRNHSRERPFFDYVRAHWRDYMFRVNDSLPTDAP